MNAMIQSMKGARVASLNSIKNESRLFEKKGIPVRV
jgi:hypothetical protein